MVADAYARKHFSPAALLRGERFGKYYCYEEDCAYAIVAWEYLSFAKDPAIVPGTELQPTEIPGLGSFTRTQLLKSLSLWNADYLIERGIDPDPESFRIYTEHTQANHLRAQKSEEY